MGGKTFFSVKIVILYATHHLKLLEKGRKIFPSMIYSLNKIIARGENMIQTERIALMESYLDEANSAVKNFSDSLERYLNVQSKIHELSEYYSNGQWRQDFEDDEAGKIPGNIKRGVLSEDALYDFLTENDSMLEQAEEIIREMRMKRK